MGSLGVTLFGYTFTQYQLDMIAAVLGSLFGLLLLFGVVTKATKAIIWALILIGLVVAIWYGLGHGWFSRWVK